MGGGGRQVTRLIREGAFPNLKHLDVRGSVYIPTLLPITPSLEVFRTGWVKEVSEDMLPVFKLGFDSIWNIRRAVPPCPLLHTLEFHSLYPQALEQVVGLLAPCTRMRDLTMTYCKAKNTDHLGSIVEQCPGLTSLNLRASALQHGVLTTIAHTCHELTSLNIGCVKPVTDGEFAQILEGCPKITALDLCYCQGLSKEMLIRATQVLDLTELGMSGFKEVTDTDVQSIVQVRARRQKKARGCPATTSVFVSLSPVSVCACQLWLFVAKKHVSWERGVQERLCVCERANRHRGCTPCLSFFRSPLQCL